MTGVHDALGSPPCARLVTRHDVLCLVCLSLVLSMLAVGCTTVAYTPTQTSVPKIAYTAAGRNLMVLKGGQIYDGKRFFDVTDVKAGPETVEVLFKPQDVFGGAAGGPGKYTIPLKALDVPPVMTRQGGNVYSMIFKDDWVLVFRAQQDAITFANALFIVARRVDGGLPASDAAEAALQEQARGGKEPEARPASVATPESHATVSAATVKNAAGRFTTIEVMRFSQADGVRLSETFVNAFYGSFREAVVRMNVADQVIGEGVTTPDADAAHTVVVEGRFTEYASGGFLPGTLSSEITLFRKSDRALITTLRPKAAFKATPFNTDTGVGQWTGRVTASQIRNAFK